MGTAGSGVADRPRWSLGLAPPFGLLALGWAVWSLWLASALSSAALTRFEGTQAHFLLTQDLPDLLLGGVLIVALARLPGGFLRRLAVEPRPRLLVPMAALCVLVGLAGFWLVFQGYMLSLDEYLADFDARVFAHGILMAPIAPSWRRFADALQPLYMLPIPSHDVWASEYLPVHAMLRAAAASFGLAPLLNPLLGAFSIVAVYAVARRLWPERPDLAVGSAALLASSSQLLITGMTAYAMPAHLAFNLAWLWLFLRGGRLGHAGAIAVGFLATGLHRAVFHPLFAAPFVLQLWLERRWRLAGAYTLAYAVICGFWIGFWQVELRWVGEGAATASAVGGDWVLGRVSALVAGMKVANLSAISASLARFAAWQNPLTAPLAAVGAAAAFRAKGHLRALLLGIAFTLLATLLTAPSQTQGWGYRYLHGLLGSICLIAAWTWARLTDRLTPPDRIAARGAFVAACALSWLVVTPLQAWQAFRYVQPYATANSLVRGARAPVVVVDNNGPWFDMGGVVRNDPFLRDRPKVMLLAALDEAQVKELCARGPVAVFDGSQAAALGMDTVEAPPDPASVRLRRLMAGLDCGRPLYRARG